MGKIIIFGDDHVRYEEPHYSAKRDYFQWTIDQEWNNSNNIGIHTGDLFHRRSPSPKEYQLVHWWLNNLNLKHLYILTGNGIHEFNRSKMSYAVDPLNEHETVDIVYEPGAYIYDNVSFLLLPAIPPGVKENKTQKDFYEEWAEENKNWKHDYIVGHFFHTEEFGELVGISQLEGKRRFGHYHIPNSDKGYVGVNTITRGDEKGVDCYLNIIDGETGGEELQKVPQFIDYYDIDYNTAFKENLSGFEASYPVYNIYNAPDLQSVYNKFGKIYINQWYTPEREESGSEEDVDLDSDNSDISIYLEKFFTNKNINDNVQNKIRELIL